MTRLTKDLVEQIARKAVDSSLKEEFLALKEKEHTLAEECYNSVFDKELLDKINTMPKNWLRHCDCLRFNANGWQVNLKTRFEVPTPHKEYCTILGTLSGELAEKVQAFATERDTFHANKRESYLKLKSFLYSFTTIKKLRAVWPEGAEYYNEFDLQPVGGLPAPITAEINQILKIKVE